jgi:hypothetical protein
MIDEYEPPLSNLKVSDKGIQGFKKWALWSDSEATPGKEAQSVRLWIRSGNGPKGNDKLVITSRGNIGIGMEEPSAKLQISGDLVMEKIASPLNSLSDGAARIYNDDKGFLHIQCPGDGNGTLEVTGDLKVNGNIAADKGLSVKNGLLEAKSGMTVGATLTADAVAVSGGALEALKGLKVSSGLLEAKSGMTVNGLFTANCPVTVGDGSTVSGTELRAANGLAVTGSLNANNALTVRSNNNEIMSADGNGVFVGQWIDGGFGKPNTPGGLKSDLHVNGNIKGSMPMSLSSAVDFTWWGEKGPYIIDDASLLELYPIPAFFWPNGRHRWVLWVHVGNSSELEMETEISIYQSINDKNILEDIVGWKIKGRNKGWSSDINISNIGKIVEGVSVDRILIENKHPEIHVAIYAIGIIHEGTWDSLGKTVHIAPE